MKKQTGIWIDSAKATIFTLVGGKEQIETIESNIENRIYHDKEGDKGTFIGSHHLSNERKFDERRKQQLQHFFDEVLLRVADAQELYVFGPGETKVKLEKRIEHEKIIAEKLKKTETADSMTENQVAAKVREFYKTS